ncbi:YciI family protein [Amycolatopsis albispora]|uniref:Transcription initiation protein n=1 Tax=Amycolatopsis albispora TaxID=1804986 RepID=A0A344LJY7_9PSEU|nr:YciI family protein [Amycolatopsis albispora]AXB48361.1 transcription initiation protein [Amycolatopsis albispora]
MKYLLLIGGPADEAEDSAEVCGREDVRAWVDEMTRRGVLLDGELLHPAEDATTLRVRDGRVLLSDGPFAETKEQIGGYNLIECASLDEAVEVASRHPVARTGLVEVRPVLDPADLPG